MTNKPKKILVVSFQSLTANSGAGMARLGYYLSQELSKRNLLKDFIVYSKGKFNTDFKSSPVSYWSRHILFLLNKLNQRFHFAPHKFRLVQEILFDRMCANRITKDVGILFVTQPYLLRTFKKAKKMGVNIIFIPANPEENYIKHLVTEEKNRLAIDAEDAYTYEPRIAYFNKSLPYIDTIIGTYPTVYKTYKIAAYKGEVVEMTGHLKPDFKPIYVEPKPITSDTLKIGYLAHTVVLKGLHYLLEAWKQLQEQQPHTNAELHIAGAIDASVKVYIDNNFCHLPKVIYTGRIPDVQAYMQSLDLFVVPSLIDGGPYTALEAAHYGTPVIITENCGSAELLSRGTGGCMEVPIRSAEAIREQILWVYNNRQAAVEIGMTGKQNLDSYEMGQLIQQVADELERRSRNEQSNSNKQNKTNNLQLLCAV